MRTLHLPLEKLPDSIFKYESIEDVIEDTELEDYEDDLPEYGTLPNYEEIPLRLLYYSNIGHLMLRY